MSKKICERPRWGGGDGYERHKGKIRLSDLEVVEDDDGNEILDVEDSGRKHQAMSRGRGDKMLGENLAPLYRFLESEVGRPWDKVYSDIRKNVRFDSATQLHILQHMKQYVYGCDGEEKEVIIEKDGRFYRHASVYYSYQNADIELQKGDLFVHPQTGLLSRYKKNPKPRYRRITEEDVRKIDNVTYFCKMKDGIWYEIKYDQKYAHENNQIFSFRSSFRKVVGHPEDFEYNKKLDFEIRTLPKKVLKQYGLKNDKK